MGTSSIEEERFNQELLSVVHKAYGDLPFDDQLLPILKAWLKVHVCLEKDALLFKLLAEELTDTVLKEIHVNRSETVQAVREYNKLTRKF